MQFVFFSTWFWLFSQSWTFYARKATESAVCFSEWAHLLTERCQMQTPACPPAQFKLLSTSQNLIYKIWSSSKSKSRPIFEGQHQIIFRRIMHRGQKLELRLWRSGRLSWVPLGETVDWFREVWGWFPQFLGQKRTWTRKKSKSHGIKSDPHMKRPNFFFSTAVQRPLCPVFSF